jgi:hypothetical protein
MKNIDKMDQWVYNKKVRELEGEIDAYKIHAEREIKNNKVCHPKKVRDNSQRFLEVLKKRYKEFTGNDYDK